MASYNPDFMIFLGDFLLCGETQMLNDTWDNWLGSTYQYWRTDGRLIPMIVTIGNHECWPPIYDPSTFSYDPAIHASNFYMLFSLPGNERWYSIDWGPNLHVTILDSETGRKSQAWDEQVDWLEQDLENNADKLWKVVGTQRPAFTSAWDRETVEGMRIQSDWVPIFEQHHLDFYFNGDAKPINLTLSEEPQSPENGTIYITSGGWGAPLGSNEWKPPWWSAYGPDSRYHITLVDISENGKAWIRSIDLNREVFDEVIVQK